MVLSRRALRARTPLSTSGCNFAVKGHMIHCLPTVTAVLSFLHSLYMSGLSYSALNTARSAVSNIDMNDSDAPDHTHGRKASPCLLLP